MHFHYNLLFIKKVDIPATAAYEHSAQLRSMHHGTLKIIASAEGCLLASRVSSFIFVAPFLIKLCQITRGSEGTFSFFVADNSEPVKQNTLDYSQ